MFIARCRAVLTSLRMTAPANALSLFAFFRFSVRFGPNGKGPIDWLGDHARRESLGKAIFGVPLFRDQLKVGKANDDDFSPITPARGPAVLRGTGDLLADFQDREDAEDIFVRLQLAGPKVELTIKISNAALQLHHETVLDDLTAVGRAVWHALQGVAGIDVGWVRADFTGRPFPYPRPRPPRQNNNYPARSIITFLDRSFHTTDHPYARRGDPEKLTEPAPPAPATITADDDLVIVRWARTLSEDDLLAAATGHDAWIADRVATNLVDGFNDLGDLREVRGTVKPAPPLTFYSSKWRVGYKAVLVDPDGSIESSAWKEAEQIAKAKQLPDGSPVESVRIVVPLREHVFVIADRAKQAGFDAVLYPDDKGQFWDPDPPGTWSTPPRKNP
jgi:hypothetical protein